MKTTLVVAGLAALVLAACGDDEEAPAAPSAGTGGTGAAGSSGRGGSSGSAGSAGSGGSGGTAPDAGTGITVSGVAHDWDKQDPFATPPLAGVKVCLRDHPEVACATTAQDGAWELRGVPANAEIMVTLEKSGRFSSLRAIKTATTDIAMPGFENTLTLESDGASLLPNVTIDTTKGGIVFFITTPGTRFQGAFDWMRGFTVAMTPSSGRGPLYLDATHTWDPTATASAGGWGHYVNVDAGTYTLQFTVPPGVTCNDWADQMYGYPTGQPLQIRIPIVGGFTTGPVGLYCSPAPSDGGADASDATVSDGGAG